MADQSHIRANTQGSGFIGRNTPLQHVQVITFLYGLRFGPVLLNGLCQSKAVPVSHPRPIIPQFRAVVTVMATWLYIQPMAI